MSDLRAALEALAGEWESTVYTLPPGYPMTVNEFCRTWFKAPLRALLAAHPPEPEASEVDRRALEVIIGLLPDCEHPTSRGVCPRCVADAVADTYLPAVVREAEARAWDEGYEAGYRLQQGRPVDRPRRGGL